jgi:hypothetical protein
MTQLRHWIGLAALTTALVAVGCGSSNGGSGSGGSGGGNSGAGGAGGSGTGACAARPDLIAAAPACDNVTNSATAIPFTALTGAQPAPTGGTVLDGLYESTKTGVYGSTTGNGRRITFVVTTLADGTKHMLWNGEVRDATGANVTATLKADVTVMIAGTQIANTTINCGATALLPPAFDYSVSGSDLILSLSSSMAATTYTRRGCAP